MVAPASDSLLSIIHLNDFKQPIDPLQTCEDLDVAHIMCSEERG